MADYMKIPEVAQLLGLSEKTVRRRVKAGEIPSVFIGGVYRISRADLDEYLQLARVRPGKASAPPFQPSFNHLLAEERRTPSLEELNAIRVVEDDCDKLEALLERVDLTAEHNEPLARLLDNHVKVVAATTLPLIKQEALRPLLIPAASRLVEISQRIRMAEETRNIISEVEQATNAS